MTCMNEKEELMDSYVAIQVKDEIKGKEIRNELLEAGLNTIKRSFFPEVWIEEMAWILNILYDMDING